MTRASHGCLKEVTPEKACSPGSIPGCRIVMGMIFEGKRAELLAKKGYNLPERRYIGDPKARVKAAKIIEENKVDIYNALGFSEGDEQLIKIFAHVKSSDETKEYKVTVYFKKMKESYGVVAELTEDDCPNAIHNLPRGIPDKHGLAVIWTAEEMFPEICKEHGLGECKSYRKPNMPLKDTINVSDSATGLNALQETGFILDYELMSAENRRKRRTKHT